MSKDNYLSDNFRSLIIPWINLVRVVFAKPLKSKSLIFIYKNHIKMNKLIIVLLIGQLVLLGCNNKTTDEKPNASADTNERITPETPVVYKGALYFDSESQYFIACDFTEGENEWWFEFDDVGDEFINQYEDVTDKPKDIYAEVKGILEENTKSEDEYGNDAAMILRITEIITFNDLDDGNDCTKNDKVN